MRQKGSIVKRGNTYSAVYGDPKVKNKQGQKKLRWRSFPNQEAAEAFLDGQLGAIRANRHIAPTQDTWSTLFAKYISTHLEFMVRSQLMSPATAASYRSTITKHLLPYWGELRIMDMTTRACREWAVTLSTKTVAGEPISNKTIINIINTFSGICQWAKTNEFCTVNWMADAEVPRPAKMPKSQAEEAAMFLNEEEITKLRDFFLDPTASTTAKALGALGIMAGLRRGEIVALQWGSVLWERHQLRIVQTVAVGQVLQIAEDDASRAHIDVPRRLLEILQEHETWLKAQGRPIGKTDPVVQDVSSHARSGAKLPDRMFHPDTLGGDYWKEAIIKPVGLRAGLGVHALRHTYASLLIGLGENHKYVQHQMRHANIQITLDTYGHLFPTQGRDAMKRLNGAMEQKVIEFTGTRPRF
jgi:integrase